MGKNPENFEFIECPECEGTGVDKFIPVPYWDEEFDRNIESIDDYPVDRRHEFCCGKCQGAQSIEIDDVNDLETIYKNIFPL